MDKCEICKSPIDLEDDLGVIVGIDGGIDGYVCAEHIA